MKRSKIYLFLVLFFFLCSCSTPTLTHKKEVINVFAIDFSKYLANGFLFMPDEYYGAYDVIGMIRVELHPNIKYQRGTPVEIVGYNIRSFYFNSVLVYQISDKFDISKLLDEVYRISIEMGGDAFTHFKYGIETSQTDPSPETSYDYLYVSGLVINRK